VGQLKESWRHPSSVKAIVDRYLSPEAANLLDMVFKIEEVGQDAFLMAHVAVPHGGQQDAFLELAYLYHQIKM
jgi:hypothetical protein